MFRNAALDAFRGLSLEISPNVACKESISRMASFLRTFPLRHHLSLRFTASPPSDSGCGAFLLRSGASQARAPGPGRDDNYPSCPDTGPDRFLPNAPRNNRRSWPDAAAAAKQADCSGRNAAPGAG